MCLKMPTPGTAAMMDIGLNFTEAVPMLGPR
jgi:hypothetical protein